MPNSKLTDNEIRDINRYLEAGIGWDGWKDAEIFIYEALVFGEK